MLVHDKEANQQKNNPRCVFRGLVCLKVMELAYITLLGSNYFLSGSRALIISLAQSKISANTGVLSGTKL